MACRGLIKYFQIAIALGLVYGLSAARASDADDIERLLHDFLANVTEAETHDRFWADDLIYTSSRGTRSTKTEIMQGFETVAANESSADEGPAYSAEDIEIQTYGEFAVVAFKLVAMPPEGTTRQEYLNTGTLIKRRDTWKVIAWQATIIPGTIIPAQ